MLARNGTLQGARLDVIFRESHELINSRHIGVSNFRVKDLQRILKVNKSPIFANQIETHPYNAQPELHALMKEHDIMGESYAPLAPLVHKSDGPLTATLDELAKKYGKTNSQVLLRWNLQKGNVVVTTSSKETRMKEQLEILHFELSDEDEQLIDRIGSSTSYRKYFQAELA